MNRPHINTGNEEVTGLRFVQRATGHTTGVDIHSSVRRFARDALQNVPVVSDQTLHHNRSATDAILSQQALPDTAAPATQAGQQFDQAGRHIRQAQVGQQYAEHTKAIAVQLECGISIKNEFK